MGYQKQPLLRNLPISQRPKLSSPSSPLPQNKYLERLLYETWRNDTAPSERVFNLISKKRTRISSENVRYVLYLRSWGILHPGDDEEIIISEDGGKIVQVLLE